ncbi:hypothetical protein B0H13DRAFT_2121348, partial [Mycena leptocephala]
TLATKYNRTATHFRKLLSNGTQYSTTRGVSLWNAIIHDLSLKAKEAGDPSDLKTIRANFSKDDYEEMKETLSDEEEKRLRKQLREHRELKQRGIRSTNRAAAADAMQNANRVGDVLMDLYERTGVRSIALFTRGHPDDPSVPHIVDSDETRNFFQEALGLPVLDVLRLLEQWSCTRDKEVAELLSAGLRKIKNNKAVAMVYTNYREEIVHKLGVELAGWPTEVKIQRPSKMPAEHVRSVRDKLRAGAICWVVLTRGQRDKKRKQRSDKGTVRGSRDDGEDDESDDEEDETDGDEETDKEDDSDDEEEGASNPPTSSGDANSAAAPTDTSLARAASSAPASTETIVARTMATLLPADNTQQDAAFSSALPAFDFDNINWDLMLPPPSFDWSNSGFDGASHDMHAADLALAALQPQSYSGLSSDAFAAVGMPPLPGSYRSEGARSAPWSQEDSAAPREAPPARAPRSGARGKPGRMRRVRGGQRRRGKRALTRARPTPPATTTTTGQGGKPRGGSTNAATSASTASTKQPRKKHSDAGIKRGPRN